MHSNLLKVILRSSKLQAIVIPKVNSAQDVKFVAQMIDSVAPESNRNIRLIACIETAQALFKLPQICTSDTRLDALVFASEDYAQDTGIIRSPSRQEYMFARQMVVAAAHAHKLQAIDLVCIDYNNLTMLEEECIEGRSWGFTGKQAIHPKQVELIQKHFSPSEKDVEYAEKIVKEYEDHVSRGVGVLVVNDKVVDMPVVKWAQKLLDYHKQIS
jgi:citrate lyase subunit beta-like protein